MKKHIQSEHETKQNYPCPQCSFIGKTYLKPSILNVYSLFSTFIDGICFTRGQSQGKTRTEGIIGIAREQLQGSEDSDGNTNDVTDKELDGKPGEKQPTCTAAADAAGAEAANDIAATAAHEERTKSSKNMSQNQLCFKRSKQTGSTGLINTSSYIEEDLQFGLLQGHQDQAHWAEGGPLASNLSISGAKKLKSKDFMVGDKHSISMSEVGWEEGCKIVVKVTEKEDGGAPDGSSNSTKADGKRLAEVTFSNQSNYDS